MQSIQFFLILFLGTITLIRRAQQKSYFNNKLEFPSSLLGLLPHEEQGLSNLKDSVEDGNVNRVVSILQNNIKQWSFIEAQLLEPNVNLGMPEIFIPLKHLTTTLEILGNIFFMKNNLMEAKQCLERACPLMELLPPALLDSLNHSPDNKHHFHPQKMHPSTSSSASSATGNTHNYAADCFSVLRKIYLKMYGDQFVDGTNIHSFPQLDDGSITSADADVMKSLFSEEDVDRNFDVDSKIEELRQPFQHLRSELLLVQGNDNDYDDMDNHNDHNNHDDDDHNVLTSSRNIQNKKTIDNKIFPSRTVSSSAEVLTLETTLLNRKVSVPLSSLSPTVKSTVNLPSKAELSTHLYGFSGMGKAIDGTATTRSGLDTTDVEGIATSFITADMETMLRIFVNEGDDAGRRELFGIARRYFEDLDVNFPSMDLHEYASNMELGTIYLEIMARVVNEGFSFITSEIERWQEFGESVLLQQKADPSRSPFLDDVFPQKRAFDVNVAWERDPESGEKIETAMTVNGKNYLDAFSLSERNRLLILSAFDIAQNFPQQEEIFDLMMGFSLAVWDNDKSRRKETFQGLKLLHESSSSSTSSSSSHKPPRQHKHKQQRQITPATSPTSSSSHKLRSKYKSFHTDSSSTSISTSSTSSTSSSSSSSASNSNSGGEINSNAALLFEDETLSIGITSAMRSAVPTLKTEDDWTLHLILAFLIATVLIVYVSYTESRKRHHHHHQQQQQQQRAKQQQQSRVSGGAGHHIQSSHTQHQQQHLHKRNPDGLLGLFIRYLYPQYFDTDTSPAPPEPPITTIAFLKELYAIIVQWDFVQWVISLFYYSADNVYSSSTLTVSSSSVASSYSNTKNTATSKKSSSEKQGKTASSITKNSTNNNNNYSNSNAINNTNISSSWIKSIFHLWQSDVTSTSTSSSTSASSNSSSTSSQSNIFINTHQKSQVSSHTYASTNNALTQKTPNKTSSSNDKQHSNISNNSNLSNNVSTGSGATSSLAATSPESSDSSTDDNVFTSRTTGNNHRNNNVNKVINGSKSSNNNKSTPNSNSNTNNDTKSNNHGGSGGIWSGSDRDDGFYSAYGISASEDEGWQAAGHSNKQHRGTTGYSTNNSKQPGIVNPSGSKKHASEIKPVVGMPNYKASLYGATNATIAATSMTPTNTTTPVKTTANTIGNTQKSRGSPAVSYSSQNNSNSGNARVRSQSDEQQQQQQIHQHLSQNVPVTAATGVSYAQLLAGASGSHPNPIPASTASSVATTSTSTGSYKHAVATATKAHTTNDAQHQDKDKETTKSTLSSTAPAWKTTTGTTHTSTPPHQKKQLLPATLKLDSDLEENTITFSSTLPSSSHYSLLQPGMLATGFSPPPMIPSDTSPVSLPQSSLFSHVFGLDAHHPPSTPSFLLTGPTNIHTTNSSTSLLFPSMTTASPIAAPSSSTQFFFRGEPASDMHLNFLSDSPLDEFATASSSPAKPLIISSSSQSTSAPPPGLRITRSGSSGISGISKSSSSIGFDPLLGLSGVTKHSAAMKDSLFSDLAAGSPAVSDVDVTSTTAAGAQEDDGYVVNFLSNMLDDFLQPGSPAPNNTSDLVSTGSGLFFSSLGNQNAVASLLGGSGHAEEEISSYNPGYISAYSGFPQSSTPQQTAATATGTPPTSSALAGSDLSPDAPIFLPSSMFQMTPNHHPHHQLSVNSNTVHLDESNNNFFQDSFLSLGQSIISKWTDLPCEDDHPMNLDDQTDGMTSMDELTGRESI